MLRSTLLIFGSFVLPALLFAQNEEQAKLDNLRYYLSSIRDNSQAMRYYTDSAKVLDLLERLDMVTNEIESELNKFVIPDVVAETPPAMPDTMPAEPPAQEEPSYGMDYPSGENEDQNEGGSSPLSKVMPFKIKLKTSLRLQFGINSLYRDFERPSGTNPEIRTGSSWYTELALIRSSKLGGKKSKVNLQYGLGYLVNRFSFENDVRLTRQDDNPVFVNIENAKSNPRLSIGYLNIPLGLRIDIGKKSGIEIGGYGGLRVSTMQKVSLKEGYESIEEHRHSGYLLRNFIYGASAGIDVSGFRLVGRYNFTNLFRDNPNYEYNTWMIGTYFKLL